MKTLSILQVEDTEEDVLLMEYAFNEAGIQSVLRSVPHAEAAMAYILGQRQYVERNEFPEPSLLLLDLKLPGMSGLELLDWLRNASPMPKIPVIVFTSSSQRQDVQAAYDAGANAFVTKPSGIDQLVEFLEALKVFWLRYTQFPTGLVNPAIRG